MRPRTKKRVRTKKKARVKKKARPIGVFPESTSSTAAHNAAQDVLALLKDYQIADIDIDFRESFHMREVGPRLLNHITRPTLRPSVPSLLPLASPYPPRPVPTLRGRWPSTPRKVATAIGSWVFRVVTSSLDLRKPTSTTFTTTVGLLGASSCSARGLSPTSSIRSNSGSDNTAWKFST